MQSKLDRYTSGVRLETQAVQLVWDSLQVRQGEVHDTQTLLTSTRPGEQAAVQSLPSKARVTQLVQL